MAVGEFHYRFQWLRCLASEYGPESPLTRAVLHVLALHMNAEGHNCYPSQETIATEAGMGRRAVVNHLQAAEDAGWIERFERVRSGQGWRRTYYEPRIPNHIWYDQDTNKVGSERGAHRAQPSRKGPQPRRGASGAKGGAPEAEGGASRAPKVVHDVHMRICTEDPIEETIEAQAAEPPALLSLNSDKKKAGKKKNGGKPPPGHEPLTPTEITGSWSTVVDLFSDTLGEHNEIHTRTLNSLIGKVGRAPILRAVEQLHQADHWNPTLEQIVNRARDIHADGETTP